MGGEDVKAASAITVSCVTNAKDTETCHYEVTKIIDWIRSGRWRMPIEKIRQKFSDEIAASGDRDKAKDAVAEDKARLWGAMWSGTFTVRKGSALSRHSGLLCADLDALGDQLVAVRQKLQQSLHLWALFISPTGDGLKAVFRVSAEPEKHKASYRAVEAHVRELTGVQIDQKCSDVGRLCYLSYDPDTSLNESAVELPPLPEAKKETKTKAAGAPEPDIQLRCQIATALLGEIDWESETVGYCDCPAQELHTSGDNARGCRVTLDGAPTIYCFHNSCSEVVEAKNLELRSRIGKAETSPGIPSPVDTQAVVAATYFIEEKYWRKVDDVLRPATKQNFADDLRVLGINAQPSSKTDRASDVLRLMSRIRSERVLDAALPIVHDRRELIDLNCRQILNISRIRAMQPAEADDPEKSAWLHEFFWKIWDPAEMPQQRDYFLAWMQRYYQSALEGNLLPGQAIFVAGKPGIGKTFLSWRIVGKALGGFSDGARFLKGETSFNKEIAEVPLLAIDDSIIADEVAARTKFTSAIKKFVADPQITYHPKGVDEITIPCKNRVIVTCNVDPNSLGVLPRLDVSVKDKLMFFKLGEWSPSFNLPDGAENYVTKILPYWLRWLLNWQPPAHVLSSEPRYGVMSYHHPDLVQAVEEESPQATLKQIIDIWFSELGMTEPRWMSARELRRSLSFNDANRNVLAQELGGPRLGRTLSSLGKDYVLEKRINTSTNAGEYLITSPAIKKQ